MSRKISWICVFSCFLALLVFSASWNTSLALEEIEAPAAAKRGYGPEQATGKPDVELAGDNVNAWASLGADDREEWLVCEYENAVKAKAVSVYETYKPGALYKVTAFDAEGEEVLAWEGEDPTPRDKPKGISIIPIKLDFPIRKIKLYLDSPAVPDWNEIDAVGLEDVDGNKQWAITVEASTTYAQPAAVAVVASGKRNWGSEQAEGEPDTPEAGDQVTAWASATADGQKEWLLCAYENERKQAEIVVHETYNPGAIYKITVVDGDGKETLAWEGEDPTPRDKPRGVSVFSRQARLRLQKDQALHRFAGRVRLERDRRRRPARPRRRDAMGPESRGQHGLRRFCAATCPRSRSRESAHGASARSTNIEGKGRRNQAASRRNRGTKKAAQRAGEQVRRPA